MNARYLVRAVHHDGADSELIAPTVGIFAAAVVKGQLVSPGQVVGTIEVLGVGHPLRAPDGVVGRVRSTIGHGRARIPVQYGDVIVSVSVGADVAGASTSATRIERPPTLLAFTAPMSGRFYSRPSPTEPVFIRAGDTVRRGQTIGLLEVMKTFNRLVYQGDALPEVAVVDAIVLADGEDVVRGDVILALKPASEP